MPAKQGLRIGVRVTSRTSGGGRVFAERLVEALLNHPQRPEVTEFVVGDLSESRIGHERHHTISVVASSSPLRERLLGGRALRSAVARHPVDVLLCPGTAAVDLPGTPVILWPLTVAPFEQETRTVLGASITSRARIALLKALIVRACNRVDGSIFSSVYAQELHQRHARGLRRSPTTVIHPAPSLSGEIGSRARGTRPDGPLLYVSHLYPYKMVDEMIRGYAIARRDVDFRSPLLIAGSPVDPSYQARLKHTVSSLGLEDHVQFLGSVPSEALPALYQEARAFVFPSLSENAGSYALIDAFCYGVPVLSSSASSMSEMVGGAGLYFDPRFPETLAACLEHLVNSPGLEEFLAIKSAARASVFPTWNKIGAEFYRFASAVVDAASAEGDPEES